MVVIPVLISSVKRNRRKKFGVRRNRRKKRYRSTTKKYNDKGIKIWEETEMEKKYE